MAKLILIIKIIINMLLIGYPLVIFLALQYHYLEIAILCLIIIFILRLFTLPRHNSQLRWFNKVMPIIGLSFALTSWLLTKYQLLLYYPVMINTVLLIIFAYSVQHPPTIIEHFARITQKELSVEQLNYIKKLTVYWCGFFIFNGSVALITCLIEDLKWWTLYNGGISYILIGLFMGVEWLIRKKFHH